MSILPVVANDLHATLPDMGHMISAYALGVVFGAPLITIFLARMPRRAMLILLMSLYAAGNLLSAAARLRHADRGRFIAGIPHGAYFGVAALVAAGDGDAGQRAQAVSRVLLGLTIANVFGVPLATWLSQGFGWRSTFLVVGLLGVTTAVMVSRYVPFIAAGNASPRRELGVFRRLQVG
jgi:DHA1 family inner membrane transport protein